MNQKVVVKEETVRQWVRGVLTTPKRLDEIGKGPDVKVGGVSIGAGSRDGNDLPDEDEDDLRANATRRMPGYRGDAEGRPAAKSTKSDMGHEAEKLGGILKHHADKKIKIGDQTFMPSGDEEEKVLRKEIDALLVRRKAGENVDGVLGPKLKRYKALKDERQAYADWSPKAGGEFTDDDLPIGHHALKSTSGVLLDIKKSRNKLRLAKAAPEYVAQMLIKAATDYKKLLDEPMKIIRIAARDYLADLREDMGPEDIKQMGDDPALGRPNTPEEVNLTPDEIDALSSEEGLATLVGSSQFKAWFERWSKGSYQSPHGGPAHKGAPPKIAKLLTQNQVEKSRLASAMAIASKLGTFNVNDDTPSRLDIAAELGLSSKSEWELTRIDAFLMLHDPQFRYFVDGKGGGSGSRVHYWDWVMNHAEKLGFKTDF